MEYWVYKEDGVMILISDWRQSYKIRLHSTKPGIPNIPAFRFPMECGCNIEHNTRLKPDQVFYHPSDGITNQENA